MTDRSDDPGEEFYPMPLGPQPTVTDLDTPWTGTARRGRVDASRI